MRRSGRHAPDRESGDRVSRPRWAQGGRANQLAVVCARRNWPLEIRGCIDQDGGFGSVTHLTYAGREDLLGALAGAEAFVGDDACLVHTADGLVGLELVQLAGLLESDPPTFFFSCTAPPRSGTASARRRSACLGSRS